MSILRIYQADDYKTNICIFIKQIDLRKTPQMSFLSIYQVVDS